jgi:hypothetical protein
MRRTGTESGFVLAEALIASVVLAVALVAISATFGSGHQQGNYAAHAERGRALAEELAEYILSRPYYDPQGQTGRGPDEEEVAFKDFDNIDDFHGYSQSAALLSDIAGNPYPPAYHTFSRRVDITYISKTYGNLGGTLYGVRVRVYVEDKDGGEFILNRFVPAPVSDGMEDWL